MRLRTAGLVALPLAALVVLTPAGSANAASDQLAGAARSGPAGALAIRGPQVALVATTSQAATAVGVDAPWDGASSAAAATATFKVTYHGFSPAAQAAFQRAVNAWATQVVSSVPITVDATFQPLGPGILGSARADLLWRDFPGAPQPGTFYVDAIANKRAGRQLDPSPDIVASFSSNFSNWSFSSNPAPRGTYDFQSVVMHELGHGLGFLGAGRISNSQGTVRTSGFPIAYDRSTENATGKQLLSYADPSAALATQIRSGRLFFDSPAVRSANGGRTAKLYAPSTYQPGSSYSHLDDAAYPAGNPNSLMTHALGDGETIRTPGPIVKAIFKTIGW